MFLAGSLWHKDSWLPCTERFYYRLPVRMLDISLQVGWLACPPACQGGPSCLPMCCPPDHWFQGSSCQPATNHSAWIQHLEEEDFSLDWSGYSKGAHYCDPGHFIQVRFSFRSSKGKVHQGLSLVCILRPWLIYHLGSNKRE